MKQLIKLSTVAAAAVLLCTTVTAFGVDTTAAATRHEAENPPATCQGTIDSNHAGYSGSGFCNGDNAVGAYAQFTVTPVDATTATLGIRFANGASARPANLVVNGATVGTVSFESTGSWSTWSTKTVTASLNTGGNTIRLDPTTADGLPNVDHLDVTDDSDPSPGDGRQMENLGRGVVAVRSGSDGVLVSWRLLGLDPDGIGFNVYRSTAGGAEVKLNSTVLTGGTNFVDSTANLGQANTYRVRPVVGGVEQEPSGPFTLTANHATEPVVRVPLRDGGTIQFVWVGDLTGDGEYDYVIDRQTSPQSIEAYSSEGDFLWEVDMGHNSTDQNNIEGGSATIDVGHNDGVTVYDFDGDGSSEVAVRIANGVTFGDGETFSHDNDTEQFIAILDGRTGALRDAAMVPTDYISDGPMYARFAACHLDGESPSLVTYMKNRIGNGGFNLMVTAWSFDGSNVDMRWKWLRNGNHPDGHNSRCLDVDGNGTDEFVEIGFVLNGDGSLRYSLGSQGIVHGDRFHIADMDPSRPGLEGYGVQQDNPSGLREYYYDAATGEMIWQHVLGGTADVGRGMAGDIDPNHAGMEVWSFDGLYNAPTNELAEPDTNLRPWPQMGLWWDGDVTMELFNDGKIEKWDPDNPTPTNSLPRLEQTWDFGGTVGPRGQPGILGDILGDWREEVVLPNGDSNELLVFTTDQPTDIRLYTLAHNPAYRNDMTVKGYMQSHHVDYFLGAGMTPPPPPNITYAGR